ncbi:MAG: hypothetical protein DRZ76_00270 [Candidatus Nealsonbacteria bacterium]|nr:MAG: hypothetical protein DRZ76_00270 [Candidatus Nealsonbacteria bacterium]
MDEKKTNIMVIDDEEDVVFCLKNFLSRKGYCVDSAMSGEEALKKLESKNADLILLDIIMPGLKGTEVAEIVKEKYPDTKIILATAFPREGEILKGKSIMEALITKPFRLQDLYNKLLGVITQPVISGEEKTDTAGIETKVLFVKAKLLFVEPVIEVYEFLHDQLKQLSSRGQFYDLHLISDENELFKKLNFIEPEIIIFSESCTTRVDAALKTKILSKSPKTKEVTSFDLTSAAGELETLEKLINHIRKICIKRDLVEIH